MQVAILPGLTLKIFHMQEAHHMLAFIKLTPWRLGAGTGLAVHDHKKAESFVLDRIVSLGTKTYDATPKAPTQTITLVRYLGADQLDVFEVMEPKEEVMRLCAAGQEFQAGKRQAMGPAKGYHELSCDWDRVHRIKTIADQFGFSYRDASDVHDRWWGFRSLKFKASGQKALHLSEIVAKQRTAVRAREADAPVHTTYQDNLDLLDAEMSEALNSEKSGRTGLSGGID